MNVATKVSFTALFLLLLTVKTFFLPTPSSIEFSLNQNETVRKQTTTEASLTFTSNDNHAAHAPTLVNAPNGEVLIFWFGGSREGADDVSIYRAAVKEGQTSADPLPVLSANSLSQLSKRLVRKLGNPIVWFNEQTLYLAVVSVTAGGWATSRVDILSSHDNGLTFKFEKTLRISPFFNISTLIRNAPVPLENGLLIPAYFELNRLNPLFIYLNDDLNIIKSTTLPTDGIQPTVTPVTAIKARIHMRPPQKGPLPNGEFSTNNQQYSAKPDFIELNNPSSALDIITLPNGAWLMLHNIGDDRSRLQISKSTDEGASWQHWRTLANGEGKSYAYPAAVAHNNTLHIVYSISKRSIQYRQIGYEDLLK